MNAATRWWEVTRREFSAAFRRPAHWVLLAVLTLMALGLAEGAVTVSSGGFVPGAERPHITSVYNQSMIQGIVMLAVAGWFLAISCGMVVIRDVELRVTERDFDLAHARAREEGIPYQTLLSSVIHQRDPQVPVRSPDRDEVASSRAANPSARLPALGHGRFLQRASLARIASWTNAASPSPRFSKYASKRGSAVYMSARFRCMPWLHG